MDGSECFLVTPTRWGLMLEYEREDAVALLRQKLAFFSSDSLTLTEREDVLLSSGAESSKTDSLLIYGSVALVRKEAFLWFLRVIRLTLVEDMASQVVICPQIGDAVPNLLLPPLWETGQTKSFRRWSVVYWAMRCGILRGIKKRYELTQLYLDQIVSIGAGGDDFDVREEEEAAFLQEKLFHNAHQELRESVLEAKNAPFDIYHSACNEERINLSFVVSNVPTLIVVWASWDGASLDWLRKNIFNREVTCSCDPVPRPTFVADLKIRDPWLRVVREFTSIPNGEANQPVEEVSGIAKCAQIVLISVDQEQGAAVGCLKGLIDGIDGWKSPIVPLMPLWSGPKGMLSELSSALGFSRLPYFMAVQNTRVETAKGDAKQFPRICYVTPNGQGEVPPTQSCTEGNIAELGECGMNSPDWHLVDKGERQRVTGEIERFLLSTDAPLRFHARVDKTYHSLGTPTSASSESHQPDVSSFVSLSGTISSLDLAKLKNALRVFAGVRNCAVNLNVIKPSCPLLVELNPATPTKYIRGVQRCVTCSECHKDILIDKEYHFRCIQCSQVNGTLCKICFEGAKHPAHHILLRMNVETPTTVELLWGPSNVAPLELFRGVLVTNKRNTHIGVYCNLCAQLVRGRRWKCAMCYDFDICNGCIEENCMKFSDAGEVSFVVSDGVGHGQKNTLSSSYHTKDHMFLCVRHACGSAGDACLRPVMEPNAVKLLLEG
ncbi:E3 ubiquitin-protein ligase KCMF1 [Trypanosoma brucei equiperdum]|uniref:E3 ubiquitin-protein ligase KCMF1 n=1 Tax=Trypanosoma brucei equiperdum TaxID=630700 RepID=A0A3L6LD72_9TRYP|nr:E3 ubiquitin-protein ligase KCMF1 [Trypanosoma brucei equiperdum]